jgi:hypothetical protein
MGALTVKNFPFKIRGWYVEKFESIGPTGDFLALILEFISVKIKYF